MEAALAVIPVQAATLTLEQDSIQHQIPVEEVAAQVDSIVRVLQADLHQ